MASLVPSIAALAGTGVGFVKVAVRAAWSSGDLAARRAPRPGSLIAVLFAEAGAAPRPAPPGGGRLPRRHDRHRGKDGRRLTDTVAPGARAFTAACRAQGLISGLAGSLALSDIAFAGAPSAQDYLGFRGGLCHGERPHARPRSPPRVAEAVRSLRAAVRPSRRGTPTA